MSRLLMARGPRPTDESKLLVTHLPTDVETGVLVEMIEQLLADFGLRDVSILHREDREGAPTCSAVARMSSPEDVHRALTELEAPVVSGQPVMLKRVRISPNPYGPPVFREAADRAVFVSNISPKLFSTNARHILTDICAQHGGVERVFIRFHPDRPWLHSGKAIITMKTREEAETVMAALDGRAFAGDNLRVAKYGVRKAAPRTELSAAEGFG
ncbi:MAG: RNA-binding protein [Polyangiaceae bacterium]